MFISTPLLNVMKKSAAPKKYDWHGVTNKLTTVST
jgi:hypothetical protein